MRLLRFFLPIIVIAGLTVIPDALALHGAAVFLPVATFDECPTAGLAEGNVGLSTVIIQRTGIDRCKAAQGIVGSVDNRIYDWLQTDLFLQNIIFQIHGEFGQLVYTLLNNPGSSLWRVFIPLDHEITFLRHLHILIEPLCFWYISRNQTAQRKHRHRIVI